MGRMMLGFALALAVGPVALLPAAAFGQQRYPRSVEVNGMRCLEQIGHSGALETWCRTPDGKLTRIDDDQSTASRRPAPTSSTFNPPPPSYGFGGTPPLYKAKLDADRHANGGGYFAGGMAWGFFLGPLGWLVGGLSASNSDVPLLHMEPGWTSTEQAHYMMAYTSEVRSRRTTNTVVGGIVGTFTAGLLIYALSSSGE